jgi:mxaJ protein
MSSASRSALVLLACLAANTVAARELRVCADPNNLPFSNERGEGFENRIVELIAADLGAEVSYVWAAQRRGYVRRLREGECDLIPGVANGVERLRATPAYYGSIYAFVRRADAPEITSLDDPALKQLRIGVQMVGDDGANTPPAHALARRGMIDNVRGYSLYGDYAEPNPPSRILDAVAKGEIDVAVVWGPLAGYFASRQSAPLRVSPVGTLFDGPGLPMAFNIAMATRRDDPLYPEVSAALARHRDEIGRILGDYGVPRVDGQSEARP